MSTLTREQGAAFIASVNKVLSESESLEKTSLISTLSKYYELRGELEEVFPEIYPFMPGVPKPSITQGKYLNFISNDISERFLNEVRAFLEMWSTINSRNTSIYPRNNKRVFISHGNKEDWRKIQEYVDKTLEIPTLELAQEANRGRTIFQKLLNESDNCSYAVIVMTGDDLTADEQIRARENVIHEIGYFQGKYGPDRVCLLHEDGVNIPSNIHGLVYIPFPKNGIEAALGGLTRELKHL